MNHNHQRLRFLFAIHFILVMVFIAQQVRAAGELFPFSIIDDLTGGDCTLIGTWDFATKMCTLTKDITLPPTNTAGAIQINSSSIVLNGDGFSVMGNSPVLTGAGHGIHVNGWRNVTVKNVRLSGFRNGIYAQRTTGVVIKNNSASNNGHGINLDESSNGILLENNASRNQFGIIVDYNSDNNIISRNVLLDNQYNGINIARSANNTVADNTITGNGVQGVFLYSNSVGHTLSGNTISNNVTGVVISSSDRNTLTGNTIADNSWFNLYADNSSDNKIYNNNFINNIPPINIPPIFVYGGSGNAFNAHRPIGGNYWSDFDTAEEGCVDVNKDSFCDAPYRITNPEYIGAQDNLPWTKKDGWLAPLTSLKLKVGFGDGPKDPTTETVSVDGNILNIKIPLGRSFFVQLVNKDPNGNITPIESLFTLEPATVAPSIPQNALFPNNVVIEFDPTSQSTIKTFQAIHLGTVNLIITPPDAPLPVKVKMEIIEPLRLGDSLTAFDNGFMYWGNQRGIPPQILKGVKRRESGDNLNRSAYRYEPISSDVGDLYAISQGKKLIYQLPYSDYCVRTIGGLPECSRTNESTLAPRSIYFIQRDGALRTISGSDQFVSALEIFEQNDGFLRLKDTTVPNQNWSTHASPSTRNKIEKDRTVLDFTAQTTIAASYGIMQMLYTTAVRPLGWTGIKSGGACDIDPAGCDPTFLFDTSENIERGGGTMALASDYLRRGFRAKNPKIDDANPKFATKNELDRAFLDMISMYNKRDAYPKEVLGFADVFLPIGLDSVFVTF